MKSSKILTIVTIITISVMAFAAIFTAPVKAAAPAQGDKNCQIKDSRGEDHDCPKPQPGLTIVGIALDVNAKTGEFSTLIAALQTAGLVDALNGKDLFTVFAPTDAAFAKLGLNAGNIASLGKDKLTEILTYHVAKGRLPAKEVVERRSIKMLDMQYVMVQVKSGNVFINDAQVLTPDVFASNGVIHVIDTVLMPSKTIVGTALDINSKTGEFSTLIAALQTAGLVDALNGDGPFTVFAPTDAAFAKLGLNAGNIASLGKDKLTEILTYHVAKGRLTADRVVERRSIRMLDNEYVKVTVQSGNVFINDAQVLTPDVLASNGVIHVIDTVLMPPMTIVGTALDINARTGEFSTLIAALQTAGLVDALNGDGRFTVFAPTDAAFAKLGLNAGNIASLGKDKLTEILTYHVAKGRLTADKVVERHYIRMLDNQYVKVQVKSGNVFINDAQVLTPDVLASNGVIHVIDTVLMPPTTIVNTALDINSKTGEFSTLIAALQTAGLVDALNGDGPFTVFAPTDAAFAKLGLNAGNIASLGKDKLTEILTYHVAKGRLTADRVVERRYIRMLDNQYVKVKVQSGNVYINDAQVLTPDVFASNGVIHVIDTVLMPK